MAKKKVKATKLSVGLPFNFSNNEYTSFVRTSLTNKTLSPKTGVLYPPGRVIIGLTDCQNE